MYSRLPGQCHDDVRRLRFALLFTHESAHIAQVWRVRRCCYPTAGTVLRCLHTDSKILIRWPCRRLMALPLQVTLESRDGLRFLLGTCSADSTEMAAEPSPARSLSRRKFPGETSCLTFACLKLRHLIQVLGLLLLILSSAQTKCVTILKHHMFASFIVQPPIIACMLAVGSACMSAVGSAGITVAGYPLLDQGLLHSPVTLLR